MKYIVELKVINEATELYEVEADSEEEAEEKFNSGDCEFLEEDVEMSEITDLIVYESPTDDE